MSPPKSGAENASARDVFDRIRIACAEVTRRARDVRIHPDRLEAFADRLAGEPWPEQDLDPAHHFVGDAGTTLAFTIALNAINFGSGWFPLLRKRPGLSGYRTIATACKEHFEARAARGDVGAGLRPPDLRETSPEIMAAILGQSLDDPEVARLMSLFARAWRELGEWLARDHGDRFESAIDSVERSAARLVDSLSAMPLYRDVARYDELEVPLYKRAQITVADLHRAFGSDRFGRFDDLDRLTLFADNLVPHVLRCHDVLVYSAPLAARIDAEKLLEAGSRQEVEIRAVAVEAVERLVEALARRGRPTTAHALDGLLWNAGQAPAIKARPRHRARSTFY